MRIFTANNISRRLSIIASVLASVAPSMSFAGNVEEEKNNNSRAPVGINAAAATAIPVAEQLDAAGVNAFNQLIEGARRQNKVAPTTDPVFISLDSKLKKLLSLNLAQYLPRSSDWTWELALIDSPSMDAFSITGGKLVIYSGLLKKTQPTDEESYSILATLIAQLLIDRAKDVTRPAPIAAALRASHFGESGTIGETILSSEATYRRKRVLEADRLARQLLTQIGVSIGAQISMLEKSYTNRSPLPTPLDMWPPLNERITNLRSMAK